MAILCNRCGESCESPHHPSSDGGSDEDRAYGLIHAKVRGHYCSHALLDLTEYTFSLCEPCLKEMFEGFKIPVATEEYRPGTPLTEEQWADLRARLGARPERYIRHSLRVVFDRFEELGNGADEETPIFFSPEIWAEVKDSRWVEDKIMDDRLRLDESLIGHTLLVKGEILTVPPFTEDCG